MDLDTNKFWLLGPKPIKLILSKQHVKKVTVSTRATSQSIKNLVLFCILNASGLDWSYYTDSLRLFCPKTPLLSFHNQRIYPICLRATSAYFANPKDQFNDAFLMRLKREKPK